MDALLRNRTTQQHQYSAGSATDWLRTENSPPPLLSPRYESSVQLVPPLHPIHGDANTSGGWLAPGDAAPAPYSQRAVQSSEDWPQRFVREQLGNKVLKDSKIKQPLDLDTPALVVHVDAMSENMSSMVKMAAELGVTLRPHAKAHKSAGLAHMQMAAGSSGVCVAKLSEAEGLARGGVRDILITNQIVTASKLKRLRVLANQCDWLGICVDSKWNVLELVRIFEGCSRVLQVFIEVDVGQGRCSNRDRIATAC